MEKKYFLDFENFWNFDKFENLEILKILNFWKILGFLKMLDILEIKKLNKTDGQTFAFQEQDFGGLKICSWWLWHSAKNLFAHPKVASKISSSPSTCLKNCSPLLTNMQSCEKHETLHDPFLLIFCEGLMWTTMQNLEFLAWKMNELWPF